MTFDIDSIRYDGILGSDAKYTNAPTPLFGSLWTEIALLPPPDNSSAFTRSECDEIVKLLHGPYAQFKDQIARDDIDNLEDLFVDLILEHDCDVSQRQREFLKTCTSELTTIGLHFKLKFNRPRPRQLIKTFYDLVIDDGKTTQSPSYPSSHALIGRFLAKLLSHSYPSISEPILRLGSRLGRGRVVAGYHFPTDVYAGQYLADRLYDLVS